MIDLDSIWFTIIIIIYNVSIDNDMVSLLIINLCSKPWHCLNIHHMNEASSLVREKYESDNLPPSLPLVVELQEWWSWGRPSDKTLYRVKQKIFLKTRFQPHCNGGRGPILTWAFSSSWQQSAQPEDNGSLVLLNHLNSEQRVTVVQFISLSGYICTDCQLCTK